MQASELFTPANGTSTFTTFPKLTRLILAICVMLTLPFELILHRRVGKRYMNTLFACIASLLWVIITALASPALPTFHDLQVSPTKALAMIKSYNDRVAPFTSVINAAFIAFIIHWFCNRRRFGTPQQGHSLDCGIPWYIYPPLSSRLFKAKPEDGLANYNRAVAEANPTAFGRFVASTSRRSTLIRAATEHVRKLRRGQVPYSGLTWFTTSMLQPAAFLIGGAWIATEGGTTAAFGVYLAVVGIAMFVKGRILQAEWAEMIYNETDQRLEIEAMRRWREGEPAESLSSAFTVPVSRAVLPAPRSSTIDQDVVQSNGDRFTMALFGPSDQQPPQAPKWSA